MRLFEAVEVKIRFVEVRRYCYEFFGRLKLSCEKKNLLVIGQEEKLVSKRRQVCLTMRHDDFDDGQILHAVARFCKVTEEGPVESLFDILSRNDVENDKNVAVGDDENTEREIPSVLNEDISNFRAQGFAVDDDNEPAPENIPTSTDTDTDDTYRPWGSEPLARC